MKVLTELDPPRKCLINIENVDDNECFKCCIVRYLHAADRNPARITKSDKSFFFKKKIFEDIEIVVKIRDINKMFENIPSTLLFLVLKKMKNRKLMYQKVL